MEFWINLVLWVDGFWRIFKYNGESMKWEVNECLISFPVIFLSKIRYDGILSKCLTLLVMYNALNYRNTSTKCTQPSRGTYTLPPERNNALKIVYEYMNDLKNWLQLLSLLALRDESLIMESSSHSKAQKSEPSFPLCLLGPRTRCCSIVINISRKQDFITVDLFLWMERPCRSIHIINSQICNVYYFI